jgi:hypothetical protein
MAEGINTSCTCQKRGKSVEVCWAKRMQEVETKRKAHAPNIYKDTKD